MDQLDLTILSLLKQDSRLSNKEIGAQVHLTGQAVGQRINHLIDQQTITRFTIEIAQQQRQFIRLFMNNNHFSDVEAAVNQYSEVDSFYQVSGQACYVVIAHFEQTRLTTFIDHLSNWARYSVEMVLNDKKKG
ncbi:Lrp/AsnC family transcriptional regulator [Latilactobacillus sakei]|uniref:Transcriptional regulator, AsnC/Lrp family n=1 Tax=Latilactobacillus sakei subsp. sakei (strain 23K) TaxID=314315 RepID=Q38UH5_LATSS|nr:AsnC family transcriptional regulator [Latilactobacillus sakei]QMU86842.1 AsnC family transcriptional regulator [Latilactobacillus sakei]BAX67431.1 AsnC family transcriptional regulator [Latilactobacillus sakei]CAI56160.1 Transcriptional regulator, AsnC/Lrp family [Latilactobacillus sakei subsp. sakei 23K]VTU48224.1 Transcriptional regulator, AsnC/Lrp family [Lactobacillus sakei subsp. sakei 23K] [Latilactobacillus sakei]